MNTIYKYILLYTFFSFIAYAFFTVLDDWYEKSIYAQKEILIAEARSLYAQQENTRKWNSMYGGVYVKPLNGEKPNPYLKYPTLKVNDELTLIKINPAWMSRQLAELSSTQNYTFRITGLNPINPKNVPTDFERRAISKFKNKNIKEYYELNNSGSLNYMGALPMEKSCLECHSKQNYKIGEVTGGISISLNSNQYTSIIDDISNKLIIAKIFILLFLSVIVVLIRKQFKYNEKLSTVVREKTTELVSTKKLLQTILDADKSFVLVSDDKEIIFANKTILDFAGFSSLDDFKKKHKHISDKFEYVDNEDFLKPINNGIPWIEYLIKEQYNRELKVLVKKGKEKIYFKPHAKKINIDESILHLITFDNITHEYHTIQKLEKQALTDPLTKLFNRRKLDDVLTKEMDLSFQTKSPLSLIFLDIDYFKVINDTLGHDVGDIVLIELANIITKTTRQGDFISRWGGEEFMIALQSTDYISASKLAEKLRLKVESYEFIDASKITISLGVTELKNNESKEDFTKRVDEALYEAKHSGRNKVVIK